MSAFTSATLVRAALSATAIISVLTAARVAAARAWNDSIINKVSGIYETTFMLEAGETYDFWTGNLTLMSSCSGASPDPVMHLWRTYPSTGHVASNDDCNVSGLATGLNPCIRYTAPSSLPPLGIMFVTVVVHGYSTCTDSQGRFRAAGPGIIDPNTTGRFGGMHLDSLDPYWGLAWLQNDTIQIVRSPDSISPTASFRAYATRTETNGSCFANDIRLLARAGSGIAGGASMVMSSASTGTCSGGSPIRHRVIVGSSSSSDANRKARVYVNDTLIDDTDVDGLGDRLEDALLTCKAVSGLNCAHTSVAKDSDRDGIEDAAEVLGIASGSLRLPAWGANPRHKDAFVELDWAPGYSAQMGSGSAQQVAANFVGGTAAHAGNPDGLPGIALHFDIDITPSSCASSGTGCSTVYGDWGGSGAVTTSDYLVSGDNDMAVARRGVFFHGLVTPGGNAAATNWKFRVGGGSGVPYLNRNVTHALGLALGATRWGSDAEPRLDCKPSYPSVMNYAYASLVSPNTFSTGAVSTTIRSTSLSEQSNPGLDPTRLAASFGLTATSTTIDWNRDGIISSGSATRAVTRWATGGVRDCNISDVHPTIENLDLSPDHGPGLVDIPIVLPGQTEETPFVFALHVNAASQLLMRTGGRPMPCSDIGTPNGCTCQVYDNESCSSFGTQTTTVATGVTSAPATAVEEPVFLVGGNVVVGDPRLIMVYMKGSGAQRDAYARGSTGPNQLGAETDLNLTLWPSGPDRRSDGALVHVHDHVQTNENNYFYYLGSSGTLRRARLSRSVDNPPLAKMSDTELLYSGQPVSSIASPTAMVISGLPYVLTTDSQGALKLWRETGDFNDTLTAIPNMFPSQSAMHNVGRPSMTFHGSMSGGAVHVVYPSTGALFGAWSVGSWSGGAAPFLPDGRMYNHQVSGIQSVGLARLIPLTNQATEVERLEMVSACPSCAAIGQPIRMKYAPFASGVFAFPETDSNDFVTFRGRLCDRLRVSSCSAGCGTCNQGVQDVQSLLP